MFLLSQVVRQFARLEIPDNFPRVASFWRYLFAAKKVAEKD
jgi:hypothetical protein